MPRPLLLLLAACAVDDVNVAMLEDPQAPPPFGAMLWSGPWIPGTTTTMEVYDAVPGDSLRPVVGVPGAACPAAIAPLCTDLGGPFTLLPMVTADASGRATILVTLPAAVPLGLSRRVQVFGGIGGSPYATNPWDGTTTGFCPGDPVACNLLANVGFDDNIAPWRASPSVLEISHAPSVDRSSEPTSGSLEARSIGGATYTSAYQCVPVDVGATYTYDGWTYLPDIAAGASTFSEYIFYSNDDCTGSLEGFDESPRQTVTGDWVFHEIGFTAPATAQSVRVGHGVVAGTAVDPVGFIDDVRMLLE